MTTGGSGVKDKKAFSKKVSDFLAGKGFYVVLFICVAVIGVSAWILLFTGNKPGTTDTNSIASPLPSSQDVMDASTLNPGDADAIDALGKKPEVTPTPSASAKPRISSFNPGHQQSKSSVAVAASSAFSLAPDVSAFLSRGIPAANPPSFVPIS
jgi:hypothetical protein